MMISNATILLLQLVAVVSLISIKHHSDCVRNANVVWKFDVVDTLVFLFIAINALFGVFSIMAASIAVLFLLFAKATVYLKGRLLFVFNVLLGLFALLISSHIIPGFYRPLIFQETISTSKNLFTLYLSTDKGFVGVVLLAYVASISVFPKFKWFVFSIFSPLIIIALAVLLGIPLDIKIGSYLFWFIPANMFITCLAEELFFREMIQKWLMKLCPNTFVGGALVVTAMAYLFVLAHGIVLIDSSVDVLYFSASLLYALIYYLTRSVVLSISAHFSMNLFHILFLEYPFVIT